MKMKVLHMITSLNRGGVEVWLMNMLRSIPREECQMDFCCKGDSLGAMAEEAAGLGANLYHVPLKPTHVSYIREVTDILKHGGYDIVHNHLETYSWIPVWIAKRLSIPVITSFHNTRFAPQTWTRLPGIRQMRTLYSFLSVNYALKYSDIVTGCSKGVLEALNVKDKREKQSNHVLYYGIDFEGWPTVEERSTLRKKHGIPEDAKLIVHVGRFAEQKNHKGLVDMFEIVNKEVKGSKLILIGDGPLRKYIEDYTKKKGLQDRVEFLGIRDDVKEMLAISDMFLFPSLHEGFGIAAVEASAVGLPVVGSRIIGLEEVVKDSNTGYLFETHDIKGMATAATKLLLDPNENNRLGEAGIIWARNNFSIDASKVSLMKIYNEGRKYAKHYSYEANS